MKRDLRPRVTRPLLLKEGDLAASLNRLGMAGENRQPKPGSHVHLVGVGGTGMSNLAAYLQAVGCRVTGSDMAGGEAVEALRSLGISVTVGHRWSNVQRSVRVVVATAAVGAGNPDLRAARRMGMPVIKYAQMLGLLMRGKRGVAVAGTHGKTTTCSMIATVLRRAGLDPSFMIGGMVPDLTGEAGLAGCAGGGELLVAEACEYDRSFLNLRPWLAVITNIEREHLDYFKDEGDLVDAFNTFASRVRPDGVMVVNAGDPLVMRAVEGVRVRKVSFGEAKAPDWRCDLEAVRRSGGITSFAPEFRGRALGGFKLRPPGRHNVLNALAAAAACVELGVDVGRIRRGLEAFRGTRRRFEHLGTAFGIECIDDYAHHPTEVSATLSALREEYPHRHVWCVFQPHQHSRTRLLMDGFAGAFGGADVVIVPDIYAVRDTRRDMAAVSSADLVDRLRTEGRPAEYVPSLAEVVDFLAENVDSGDVVLTLGAGPVDAVGRSLLRRLGEDEHRTRAIETIA